MKIYINNEKAIKVSAFLRNQVPEIGFDVLQKLFRKGEIRVNNKKIYSDCEITVNDAVTVFYNAKFTPKTVYEDENIAVFYKPVKIASQGENSYETKIKTNLGENFILCHRLDTNTAGLLLFAKSEAIFNEIKNAFKSGKIQKFYLARVIGIIDKPQILRAYLLKDAKRGMVKILKEPVNGAEEIITKIMPLSHDADTTMLDVELVTGKTHQIRAHLSFIGHPIIGDGKYGKNQINEQFKAKYQDLTAYKLVFKIDSGSLKYLFNKEILLNLNT